MSFYRDTYLKSDHWKNLRVNKLAHSKYQCAICGFNSPHNDVHHISYSESIWTVSLSDLRVLCRGCHDRAHVLMKENSHMRALSDRALWTRVFFLISKENRLKINELASQRRRAIQDGINNKWNDLWVWAITTGSRFSISFLVCALDKQFAREKKSDAKWMANNEIQRASKIARLIAKPARTEQENLWLKRNAFSA